MSDAIDDAITALTEILNDKTADAVDRINAAVMIFDRSYLIRPEPPGEKSEGRGDVAVENTGPNHEGTDTRGSVAMFNDITVTLQRGGQFTLTCRDDDVTEGDDEPWMAALIWGSEGSGSPMAGAAAYGMGSSPAVAVEKVLRHAGR